MDSEVFVDNENIRNKVIDRIDVLDRVKSLILLPNTEFASMEMVAKYYGVSIEAVKKLATRNKNELISDGYESKGKKEIINEVKGHDVLITSMGKKGTSITLYNGSCLIIPNRGLRTFPKRAILRVGMLLRDSKIAKEVRTQLLNIVETAQDKLTHKEITKAIDVEDQLLLRIFHADDPMSKISVIKEYKDFKDRKINALKDTNKVLKANVDQWDTKELIRRLVNRIANENNSRFGQTWNDLYKDLHYRYNIIVRKRKYSGSRLGSLTDDELSKLAQVAVSHAISDGIDISKDLKHKPENLNLELK